MKTLLMALALSLPALASALPLAPFKASYAVSAYGLPLGEAQLTLRAEGADGYRLDQRVEPVGVAAMLVSDGIIEHAVGVFQGGEVRPTRYRQERSRKGKLRITELSYDWPAATVLARSGDKVARLPLDRDTSDPLNLQLGVMWDLERGHTPQRYRVIDDTELKTYTVEVLGEEQLDTALGRLQAIRVERAKPGGSRVTTFWFAPSLQHLPVQVTQRKSGREVLRMQITGAQIDGR